MKRLKTKIEIKHRPIPMYSRILQQHGAREIARRKAQIAKGQLKAENGLVA